MLVSFQDALKTRACQAMIIYGMVGRWWASLSSLVQSFVWLKMVGPHICLQLWCKALLGSASSNEVRELCLTVLIVISDHATGDILLKKEIGLKFSPWASIGNQQALLQQCQIPAEAAAMSLFIQLTGGIGHSQLIPVLFMPTCFHSIQYLLGSYRLCLAKHAKRSRRQSVWWWSTSTMNQRTQLVGRLLEK